jgi:hypothetical protein
MIQIVPQSVANKSSILAGEFTINHQFRGLLYMGFAEKK